MEADVRIDTPPDTGSETSATVEASTESTPDSEPIRLTAEHNPQRERTGVLLINLGTPDEPSVPAVRRFLAEFLSDARVIDVAPWLRFPLVYGAILPFRPFQSAQAYRKIWGDLGSPLMAHTLTFAERMRRALGSGYVVEIGMRYGSPSIPRALEQLVAEQVSRIVVFPLYPQYAASSTGSALDAVYRAAAARWNVPSIATIAPFYSDARFVRALAAVARPLLENEHIDHLVMSYHGLPERQVRRSDESGRHCFASDDCCARIGETNQLCYRAHCLATSRELARELGLPRDAYSISFQSRLGRDPWLRPSTPEMLDSLIARGVKRVAVICPAFVADCLETLEEIAIRAREQWLAAGGEELIAIPCLNDDAVWVAGAAELVREAFSATAEP